MAVVGASLMRSGRQGPDSETDDWAPRGFDFFPIYPKLAQI
jgi:hypothetical protein